MHFLAISSGPDPSLIPNKGEKGTDMGTKAIPVQGGEIVNLTADVPLVIGVSYLLGVKGLVEVAEVDAGDEFPATGHPPPVEIEQKAGSTIQVRGIELFSSVALTEVA